MLPEMSDILLKHVRWKQNRHMEIRKWNPSRDTTVSVFFSHKYHIKRLMRSQSHDAFWSMGNNSLSFAVWAGGLPLPLLDIDGLYGCVCAVHATANLLPTLDLFLPKSSHCCAPSSLHNFTCFHDIWRPSVCVTSYKLNTFKTCSSEMAEIKHAFWARLICVQQKKVVILKVHRSAVLFAVCSW